jgi:predicted nucleic acid-binding protein
MNDRVFLDTNLWVYFYTKDPMEKTTAVSALITDHRKVLVLSTQILGELYNVMTRKKLFTKSQAASILTTLSSTFPTQSIDTDRVLKATEISDRYGYTYWDNLILATACLSNCRIVYSEDMQHNQLIDGQVRILNPLADQS